MLDTLVLAAIVAATPASALPGIESTTPHTMISRCFATMDGAVYHGDPSDRKLMKANVATCEAGIAQINAMRVPTPAAGPEKLIVTARVLERAATLSFMGLGDSATALREVRLANVYFRVASALPGQSATYHDAAVANVALTRLQLQTLRAEIASARRSRAPRKAVAYHKL